MTTDQIYSLVASGLAVVGVIGGFAVGAWCARREVSHHRPAPKDPPDWVALALDDLATRGTASAWRLAEEITAWRRETVALRAVSDLHARDAAGVDIDPDCPR